MLENTVANGEKPAELIVYGGSGRAARNWECFHAIVAALKALGDDETLVIQSGKPVAVFRTSPMAPKVLTANTNLVGKWATWPVYRALEAKGLIMYGQYTAGTWAYIGTQGILQGTYETFAAAGKRFPSGDLRGRIVLTAGLGGMGGAQPLAVKMAGGVCIAVEVDPARAERRVAHGLLRRDRPRRDRGDAARARRGGQGRDARHRADRQRGGPVPGVPPAWASPRRWSPTRPRRTTRSTATFRPGIRLAEAVELRARDPDRYVKDANASIVRHVGAMLGFQDDGAIVFEYGNNIRGQAEEAGEARAFEIDGFVPLFIRPSFAIGRGPFRWVCLSGDPDDLKITDEAALAEFPDDDLLKTWMAMARERVPIQGLPARSCWLGLGERDRMGLVFNRLVREGKLKGPVAMSRDHLDTGSVAQPTRETEKMKDGSDPIADWPLLNALLNAVNGADLVSIHQGGGSGMGGSISAGMTVIADGSAQCRGTHRPLPVHRPGDRRRPPRRRRL